MKVVKNCQNRKRHRNSKFLSPFFQTLQDKECEWAKRNEALRKDLRQAIRCSIADTERETESLENLEQVGFTKKTLSSLSITWFLETM